MKLKINKQKILTGLLAIITAVSVVFSISGIGTIEVKITPTIELDNPEFVENSVENVENLPYVSEVDGGKIADIENTSSEEQAEAAKGYTVDISTPEAFINATYGQCIYLNNPYGSQCYNTTALLMENQVGYYPSTCGTGGAKGIWYCRETNSRGNGMTYYRYVENPEELRKGDIANFDNGEYGHTGMVAGDPFYRSGVLYIPLYSTNQGGKNCEFGGQASNIINVSANHFIGALRWSGWDYLFDKPNDPVIPISGCHLWDVKPGDTMSKIMMDCEHTLHYGEIMDNYAKTWYSLYAVPNQSVYDGWHSKTGVGLYANDTIEKRD